LLDWGRLGLPGLVLIRQAAPIRGLGALCLLTAMANQRTVPGRQSCDDITECDSKDGRSTSRNVAGSWGPSASGMGSWPTRGDWNLIVGLPKQMWKLGKGARGDWGGLWAPGGTSADRSLGLLSGKGQA
jgi:hypothetical protein